jgi:hypothetical protein
MKMHPLGLAWLCALGAACSSPRPAPPSARAPQPSAEAPVAEPAAEHTSLRAPFTMALKGPKEVRAGDTITLELTLHRQLPGDAPLDIRFFAPDGARVLRGALQEKTADGPDLARRWELALDRIPAQDAHVSVSLVEGGVTAHGKKRYGFGRAVEAAAPPRRGVDVDGTGGAVPLD